MCKMRNLKGIGVLCMFAIILPRLYYFNTNTSDTSFLNYLLLH